MGKKQAQQLEEALNEGAGNVEKVKQVKFSRIPIVFRCCKLNFIKILLTVVLVQVGKELGLRSKQISSWLKKRNVG